MSIQKLLLFAILPKTCPSGWCEQFSIDSDKLYLDLLILGVPITVVDCGHLVSTLYIKSMSPHPRSNQQERVGYFQQRSVEQEEVPGAIIGTSRTG